jgi:signal transduction histidine kinase
MHGRREISYPLRENRQRFVLAILMLVAVFVLGITYLVRSDYNRTLTEAEKHLEYFAELFEQSVESGLLSANLQIGNMIDRFTAAPAEGTSDIENRYGDMLRSAVRKIDQIDSLVVIAPNGIVVWSSVANLKNVFLGDRKYFQAAMKLKSHEFSVGVPLFSRASGRRLTPIAWPIISSSNEVLGVIVSSLGEDYFSDVLTLNDFPEDMQVDVLTSDGAAAFQSEDRSLGITQKDVHASRKIVTLGLTITVSRSQEAVMAAFYQRTAGFLAIANLLFATLIGMAIRLQAKSNQLAIGLIQSEKANHSIRTAQREFDTIFENVGDGIVIFNKDGSLKRTNKIARKLLGDDDSEQAVERLRTLLPNFAELDTDLRVHHIRKDDGESLQCRVMKLTSNNQDVAYCVLADISAEERLAAARDNFVTSINHELRTPLTSLSGSLELLQYRFTSDLPAPAKRLVTMASRNADRLLLLVNDILTLQAIDQGQFHVRAVPLEVNLALEDAVASNSGYGLASGVKLICERFEKGLVFVDPDRLQQIFSNLISNAIKYSPANGTVKIGAAATKGQITFYVRDNGPGIPRSSRDRLFDRFATPIHDTDVQVNGTGLGLAISKQLVERQGGTITFETYTEQDEVHSTGTVFFLTFKSHILPMPISETNA